MGSYHGWVRSSTWYVQRMAHSHTHTPLYYMIYNIVWCDMTHFSIHSVMQYIYIYKYKIIRHLNPCQPLFSHVFSIAFRLPWPRQDGAPCTSQPPAGTRKWPGCSWESGPRSIPRIGTRAEPWNPGKIRWSGWWWLEHQFYVPDLGNFIIPMKFHIFAEGLRPPTSHIWGEKNGKTM